MKTPSVIKSLCTGLLLLAGASAAATPAEDTETPPAYGDCSLDRIDLEREGDELHVFAGGELRPMLQTAGGIRRYRCTINLTIVPEPDEQVRAARLAVSVLYHPGQDGQVRVTTSLRPGNAPALRQNLRVKGEEESLAGYERLIQEAEFSDPPPCGEPLTVAVSYHAHVEQAAAAGDQSLVWLSFPNDRTDDTDRNYLASFSLEACDEGATDEDPAHPPTDEPAPQPT